MTEIQTQRENSEVGSKSEPYVNFMHANCIDTFLVQSRNIPHYKNRNDSHDLSLLRFHIKASEEYNIFFRKKVDCILRLFRILKI